MEFRIADTFTDNIRLIVHKTDDSLLLCYVDHHDKAYQCAERRKLETHPKTGAAQFVEVRETVREIVIPQHVQREVAAPRAARLLVISAVSASPLATSIGMAGCCIVGSGWTVALHLPLSVI